jgi:hypothetical protein
MSQAAREMVINDPDKFKLLATEVKKNIIQAGIATVNIMAALTAKEAKKNIKENQPRDNFTPRSVGFTPMKDSKYIAIKEIRSFVGISEKASYMKRQEEGGWHEAKPPAKKLKIETDTAKQNGMPKIHIGKRGKQTVRGKVVNTILYRRGKHQSHKAARVARAAMAHKTGLLMYLGPNNSIFKVNNIEFETVAKGKGRAERAKHRRIKFETKMYVNRKFEKTYTNAKPWLAPACEKVAKDAQKIFNSQMRKIGL